MRKKKRHHPRRSRGGGPGTASPQSRRVPAPRARACYPNAYTSVSKRKGEAWRLGRAVGRSCGRSCLAEMTECPALAWGEPDRAAPGRAAGRRSLGVYVAVYTAGPSPPRPQGLPSPAT